jgi:hypothetical protein
MLVLPVASILIEFIAAGSSRLHPVLVSKWFVFWAVGVRLLLAGLRQMVQPGFTARTVLGLKSEESSFVVRELGFATTGIAPSASRASSPVDPCRWHWSEPSSSASPARTT